MAVLNFVRIAGLTGGALPTKVCVSCGGSSGVALVSIPRTFPFGLLFGIAFALPLLLALALDAAWGTRDLFEIMAGSGRNRTQLAILRTLPVVVAALWSIATLVALEIFCRRAGLRLTLCGPCARRQRRRRAALVAVLALSFIALAAVLYLLPIPGPGRSQMGHTFCPVGPRCSPGKPRSQAFESGRSAMRPGGSSEHPPSPPQSRRNTRTES